MGPNGVGESNGIQNQSSVGVKESPVNPVTPIEVNPNPASNPLSGLENAINAAKEALGQTESPAPQATATEPIAEPAVPQSPTEQFRSTFGDAIPQAPQEAVPSAPVEPTQAPVAEFSSIPTEVVPPIQPIEDIVQEPPTGPNSQTLETLSQPEMDPTSALVRDIKDALGRFEAAKNKTTSS